MGLRGSRQKAEITAPPNPEKDRKVKRRKSKKDAAAANGGVGTEGAQNNAEECTKPEEVKPSDAAVEESHEGHEKDTEKTESSDDKKDVESSEKLTEQPSVPVPEASESQIRSDNLEESSVKTEQFETTEPATVDENVPEKTEQALESSASIEDKECEKPVVEVTVKLVSSTDELDVSTDKNVTASEEVPSATSGTTEALKESVVNSSDKSVEDISTVKERNEDLEKPYIEEAAKEAYQTLENVPVSQDNIEVTEESKEEKSTKVDDLEKNEITKENKEEEIEENPPGESCEEINIIVEQVDEKPAEEPREDEKQSTDVSISEKNVDGKDVEKEQMEESSTLEEKETCEHKTEENGKIESEKPQSEIEIKEAHQEQISEPNVENDAENQPDSGKPACDKESEVVIKTTLPVVFTWEQEGKEVGVSGTFNKWSDPWALSENEGKFSLTRDLPEGDYLFKFVVDGNWIVDVNQPTIHSEEHGQVNIMNVQPSIVQE
ncbi:gelsolin-related protein of 125 kDa-like [Limulus polyphemus]|uniref:5'-AMP-activated protein kinase subunit beta-1 n=1 Tax=Limulus polyphemus TaxID=6850 RepID=A0ABM1BP31_LIMPO|nr:gelsolin-related protein of 125 kDa-like [Limulus polyphemus]